MSNFSEIEQNPWLQIDLGSEYHVQLINIWPSYLDGDIASGKCAVCLTFAPHGVCKRLRWGSSFSKKGDIEGRGPRVTMTPSEFSPGCAKTAKDKRFCRSRCILSLIQSNASMIVIKFIHGGHFAVKKQKCHLQRGRDVLSKVEGGEHCDPACTFQWEMHKNKNFHVSVSKYLQRLYFLLFSVMKLI